MIVNNCQQLLKSAILRPILDTNQETPSMPLGIDAAQRANP